MAASPRVSVVVPVHNRRDLLAVVLDALDEQTYDDFEVIVVDDGSSDGAGDLAAMTLVHGRPVRVIRQEQQGAVAARITGVAASEAEILAFTDSDCRPLSDWLSAGIAAIDRGADVVHGVIHPERPVLPLERSVWQENDGLYATANVFYRRSAFDAVGGFDAGAASRWGFRITPRARGLGFGEDTLLGWKVARRGVSIYEESAEVLHHVFHADFREWLSRSWQMGAFPWLLREVPEIKGTFLRRGILFGPRTRVPAYATIGALTTRRPRLVAVAAGWWAWTRFREVRHAPLPWRRRLMLVPMEMATDVVACVSLTAGSVQARTPAL